MPWDFSTDPITGDWALADGDLVRSELGETAVLHQLAAHHDRWWGDPQVGSLLHERDRYTATPGPAIEAELRRALGVLERDGTIADVEARAVETAAGRVEAETTYRQVAADTVVTGKLPIGG